LKEQLNEEMIKILFFAGIATIIIGFLNTSSDGYAWLEGFSIIFACIFITTLSAVCNYAKEKQYLSLHDAIREEKIAVIRGMKGLS